MKIYTWIFWILLLVIPSSGSGAELKYALNIQIDARQQEIKGAATLISDENRTVSLSSKGLSGLQVDGHAVDTNGDDHFILRLVGGRKSLISYKVSLDGSTQNIVNQRHILLMNGWYPQPDMLTEYVLSVTLPSGFTAVSEADRVSVTHHDDQQTYLFEFRHPLNALHLVASTEFVVTKAKHRDVDIETYFFKEDADLAKTYIEYAQKYIAMYEEMLTAYPYRRFAIVENIFPSGSAMPTMTLLGRQIIRLPFIVKTSLGHEILHQWFGTSVYVDRAHGNWSEGLTTYLSDHLYADLENRGQAYRKQILINYEAYVDKTSAIPAGDFTARRNKTESAIGYGKIAMLFHGLKERYGEERFLTALREFIRRNRFREASWHDIQRAFERTTGEKLYAYFDAGLNRTGIADIAVVDPLVEVVMGQTHLTFGLSLKNIPHPLRIPVTIYTASGKSHRLVEVDTPKEEVRLLLDEPPTRVAIDEEYSMMRTLHEDERPPVLADIMGSEHPTVVVTSAKKVLYRDFMRALGVEHATFITPDEMSFGKIKKETLVIAGYDNPVANMLLGGGKIPEEGVRLKMHANPFNSAKRVLLVHLRNREQLKAVARKLSHYGNYSELAFSDGEMSLKEIDHTPDGIPVVVRPETIAVKPEKMSTLDEILDHLLTYRIIFVGEQHDKHAHHNNQLRIIKKLVDSGVRFGVGMEMFQKPYQKSIDAYMAGKIDESSFLKQSEYYRKWRYDYNLYKPIVDYLKQNRISLIALNIEGNLSRKVAREGIENLSDREKKLLPVQLDFTDGDYRDDLRAVFSLHGQQTELKKFDHFLQAQVLWDEGMAETAYRFLSDHPGKSLVILAGNGHIRKRYGIPARLSRRTREPSVVVLQDDEISPGMADYVLLTSELKGEKSPVLGVALEENDEVLTIKSVSDQSPAKSAGLREGDIIQKLAGETVKTLPDLKVVLFYCKVGEQYSIGIKRDGKMVEKKITFFPFSPMMSFSGKHGRKASP